jgi:hypothetical protein
VAKNRDFGIREQHLKQALIVGKSIDLQASPPSGKGGGMAVLHSSRALPKVVQVQSPETSEMLPSTAKGAL